MEAGKFLMLVLLLKTQAEIDQGQTIAATHKRG